MYHERLPSKVDPLTFVMVYKESRCPFLSKWPVRHYSLNILDGLKIILPYGILVIGKSYPQVLSARFYI